MTLAGELTRCLSCSISIRFDHHITCGYFLDWFFRYLLIVTFLPCAILIDRMSAKFEFSDVLTSSILPFHYSGIFTLDNGFKKVPKPETVGPHFVHYSLMDVKLRVCEQ